MAVAEHLLAERERAAATAARISPPNYIKAELGERPGDPVKARAWDKAVRGIEGYRTRNGVRDKDSALGTRPKEPAKAHEHDRAQRQLERSQRQLRLHQQRARQHQQDLHLGIGR
ncbi:MAG: hypothetical protein ACTHK3_06770 [Solirubrobacterales bacterium]